MGNKDPWFDEQHRSTDEGGRFSQCKLGALPCWDETKRLAIEAHRAFSDRTVIGWDIAMLEHGPIIIEGNGNADLDILQRFMRRGLREQRFGQLIAHHLRQRLSGA
ncbi:MAG TPA: sugar-transfer associated ATP-grasp domain-containing protein [Sphingomicrobium sp.]